VKRWFQIALIACVPLALFGCDTIRDGPYSIFNSRAQTVGTNQLIEPEAFEPIYLPAVLAPTKFSSGPGKKTEEQIGVEIDQAFAEFNNDTTDYAFRRNAVQDRILAASTQRCNFFKQYLRRIDQSTNLFLGSLTTLAGAVGAIVTGATAARILAGSASVFSGLRSEFNDTMFAGLAMQVITDGIDLRRTKLRATIEIRRREPGNEINYTVGAAVNDALLFHGACSLVVGLKEAGAAIKRSQDPGLKGAIRTQQMMRAGRTLAEDGPVSVLVRISEQIGRLQTARQEIVDTAGALTSKLDAINAATNDVTGWNDSLQGIADAVVTDASLALDDSEVGLVKLKSDAVTQDQNVNTALAALAGAWEQELPTAAEQAALQSERQAAAALVALGERQLGGFLDKVKAYKEQLAGLAISIESAHP